MSDSNPNHASTEKVLFSPIMAAIYGLLITLVLRTVISVIAGTIIAETSGVDFDDASAINAILAASLTFLITDLVLTAALMLWAGRVIRRYSDPIHLKIGLLVSAVTVAVYFYINYASGVFATYPLWYNVGLLVVVVAGILIGCKRPD